MHKSLVLFVAVLTVVGIMPLPAAGQEAIRRGWNSMQGEPYHPCLWLVVTGPAAAAENYVEQTKNAYREPDLERLARMQDQVFIEIRTITERGACSNRIMEEVIFVDKDTDQPTLRFPLESVEIALSNGFGANWEANDGIAIADFAEFKSALSENYHVVVVYEDGGTERIGQGFRQTVWSGGETRKLQ